jgi:hypothetical protein
MVVLLLLIVLRVDSSRHDKESPQCRQASQVLVFGHPARTQASISPARQRVAPPSLTGRGSLPPLRNRHSVRTDTPSRLANVRADKRSEEVSRDGVSLLSVNSLDITDLPERVLMGTNRHERRLQGAALPDNAGSWCGGPVDRRYPV